MYLETKIKFLFFLIVFWNDAKFNSINKQIINFLWTLGLEPTTMKPALYQLCYDANDMAKMSDQFLSVEDSVLGF